MVYSIGQTFELRVIRVSRFLFLALPVPPRHHGQTGPHHPSYEGALHFDAVWPARVVSELAVVPVFVAGGVSGVQYPGLVEEGGHLLQDGGGVCHRRPVGRAHQYPSLDAFNVL